jgi:glyoxylase-like metal-dependent hydrolase (beta-lactamase superfamily II)
MYKYLKLLCLALLSFSVSAVERGPAIPDYPTDKIAENIYVIHGPITTPNPDNQGFMNNPGIIITTSGVVLHDPGGTVQSGEMVLRAVKKLTDKPVVAVFNSHIHGDHWLANQAVRDAYPNAVIYGHPNMFELIERGEGQSWLELMERMTEGKSKGTQTVGPDKTVNNGDAIKVGQYTFVNHYYGQAHTTSDVMLEVKEAGVVFLGDNVLNGRLTRLDTGSMKGNILACESILKTNAKFYVPGHGKSGGREVVNSTITYLSAVYNTVKTLYEEGLSDFEMKNQVAEVVKEYAGWISYEEQLGKHISYAYLEVEAADF